MNKNYNISNEEREVNYFKELYQKMIDGKKNSTEQRNVVDELLKRQKADGSWSVIDDYRVDSDIRVEYVYIPTYYATAALINADLHRKFSNDSNEKNALLRGLDFAKGRNFMGHGYRATASMLQTLTLYKQAGIYEWMYENEEFASEFCNMFHNHIKYFKQCIETGSTYSDWNQDFKEEYKKEISDYEEAMNPYVWYAAYGSNINRERFMEYINRCSDNTAPVENRPYILPYNIYFASKSRLWERKGVAFLDDSKKGMAMGRVYKITIKQFKEIQRMEGCNYAKTILLGELEDSQVLTFTSMTLREDKNEASNKYMEVIKNGLQEVYPDKTELVLDMYLYTKGGLQTEDIEVLRFIRNSQHGVTLDSITNIGKCMTKLRASIKRLYYYGFIKQDKRSVRQGCDEMSPNAVVYTNQEKRELCDIIILTVY